ncbi:LPS export ABC transporter periplasmic protein LptC [Hahella aquimaris]|uniref:LPS export ABC transporter periplasmic protein LptC n=1 Tax=Hahella sp. HNIBRBA332 TaxID=3015983 RepID=UPI00273AD101|nr:LPS export ABC transporter periplasmic protein LptC [Hahella sp. HNIBRBA332]WLQ14589.1 LPS export ABC transporter periplasmic protein LptC [Hahella sp. HNIBRBA332]
MTELFRQYSKWLYAALAAFLVFYLVAYQDEASAPFFEEESLLKDEPDAFVINAVYTTYNKEGALTSRLQSQLAKHYPDTDTGVLTRPNLEIFQQGEKSWHVESLEGELLIKQDTLKLRGDVEVNGASNDGAPILMQTQALDYNNKSRFISTDQPVKITSNINQLTAVGMEADIDKKLIVLLSQVTGVYAQPK